MELATEQADQAIEPPQVEPPPPVTEDVAEMSAEGDVPEVAEQAAVEEDGAKEAVSDQGFQLDNGVHVVEDYRDACEDTDSMDKWDDKYAVGHTSATQFVQPYEGRYSFQWSLQKGQSASEGVQAWLKGLTISDYRAAGVAVEIDEVRDEMGDQKFDRLFGSKNETEDAAIPAAQRLSINSAAYTTPIDEQMRQIGRDEDAKIAQAQNGQDPNAWSEFEREPAQDAEEKKDKADEVIQQSPVEEQQQDKTLA